jgi:bacterioferritin
MAIRSPKGKIWDDRLQKMLKDGGKNLEEGPVTEAYKANKEEVIELLDRALASEWTAYLQYYHHHFMATDIHSAEIREYFKEAAAQELHHIEEIGERIQMLGGVPTHKPREIAELWPADVEYGHDLRSMLEVDLMAERGTINFYSEIVRFCGFDDIVTRVLFEEILREEHEHANELADLLFASDASTNEVIPSLHDQVGDMKDTRQRKIA